MPLQYTFSVLRRYLECASRVQRFVPYFRARRLCPPLSIILDHSNNFLRPPRNSSLKSLENWSFFTGYARLYTSSCGHRFVLGIETSCDDTGAAVVDSNGVVLGEAIHSQQNLHIKFGGIIPPIAKEEHRKHIDRVVTAAIQDSKLRLEDLDAIATTVKPGLELSLIVGLQYGKELVLRTQKPFIPVHHMEAHALTIRMVEKVDFPFLVLLISGGHCQVAVVRSVSEFLLLGTTIDDAPGEALDKTARRLKLKNLPEYATTGGGRAIELLALKGDPLRFQFTSPMSRHRDCNFSFSGLKFLALRAIKEQETIHGIEADGVIPNVADLCASFQHAIACHLVKRLQRAMIFCDMNKLLPETHRVLVISGGVACNSYVRGALNLICDSMGFTLKCPTPKLCTDNGIMIAWNGMEKLIAGVGVAKNAAAVDIEARSPLGQDITAQVRAAGIKNERFKLDVEKIRAYTKVCS